MTAPGLAYRADAILAETEVRLLATIDAGSWFVVGSGAASRQTQHYGYAYDYRSGHVRLLGALPDWLLALARDLGLEADQAIVNEYQPGQGISAHIDSPLFGDTVWTLSLGSPVLMDFHARNKCGSVDLAPRSLLTIGGEARQAWTHGIVARKTDLITYSGTRLARRIRGRRVSITFRTVKNRDAAHVAHSE